MIKKIMIIATLVFPGLLFAQQAQIDYSEPISILAAYSLASAVVLGIVTSIVVLVNGRRMRGGIFGRALNYLGVGMLIVLVGTITPLFSSITPTSLEGALPSILNTVGYVIMAFAATKLLRATRGS